MNLPDFTEIVTADGFIPIGRYCGQPILQVDESLCGSYALPFVYDRRIYDGYMTKLIGNRFNLTCSPDMPVICHRTGFHKQVYKEKAESIAGKNKWATTPIVLSDMDVDSLEISDEQLRMSMIMSMGIDNRYFYPVEHEQHLRDIVNALGLSCTITSSTSRGTLAFRVRHTDFAILSPRILQYLDRRQQLLIIDELRRLSLSSKHNREQIVFESEDIMLFNFVQQLSHMAGYKTVISRPHRQKDGDNQLFIATSERNCKDSLIFRYEAEQYEGYAYHIELPAGAMMIRQHGVVEIVDASKKIKT